MNNKILIFIGVVLCAHFAQCSDRSDELIDLFEADCSARKEGVCSYVDLLELMRFIQDEYRADWIAINILEAGKEIALEDQRSSLSIDDLKEMAQARKDVFDEINDDLPRHVKFDDIDKADLGAKKTSR